MRASIDSTANWEKSKNNSEPRVFRECLPPGLISDLVGYRPVKLYDHSRRLVPEGLGDGLGVVSGR